ncbi:9479_t:CDS:2, partial [Diversispora eburnea]
NPVCLALFSPQKSNLIYLYENDKYVGELYSLKKQVEQKQGYYKQLEKERKELEAKIIQLPPFKIKN